MRHKCGKCGERISSILHFNNCDKTHDVISKFKEIIRRSIKN